MTLTANAADPCVQANGEAALVHGDLASAKLEAVNRAKWAAIEQTVGVQIKSSSLVQNFALVDDNIIKNTNGIVRDIRILHASHDEFFFHVRIHACVSPVKAEETVAGLARDTAIGVLIVSRSRQQSNAVESNHYRSATESLVLHLDRDPLSEALKQGLIDQNIQVVDLVGTLGMDGVKVVHQLDRGDLAPVRHAMLGSMANLFILGQIDNVISFRKGADIGYGLSMPMQRITSQLHYKIFARDSKGVVQVMHSGFGHGEGMAPALEDANQEAMQDLAEQALPSLIGFIVDMIQGKSRMVDLKIDGIPDVDTNAIIKDQLQQISWVMQVQDLGVGHFKIRYPEKPLYLANSLQRIDGVTIENFSSLKIHGYFHE